MTTDYTVDTPNLAQPWCPACEPDRDPSLEILETRYCVPHGQAVPGSEDEAMGPRVYLSGSGDAGGETNRQVCDGIHRGRWPA